MRAEFALSALLLGWGLSIVLGSSNIRIPATVNVVDPRFVPRIVGWAMMGFGVLHAIEVARGRLGAPDEGEDVDLSRPGNLKAVAVVAASVIAHAKLLDVMGWPLAAAMLFFGCAMGLGAKRVIRTAGFALALSFVVYFVFAKGLGVYLPRGWLEGVV